MNVAGDPRYGAELQRMRRLLDRKMRDIGDEALHDHAV